MSEQKPIGSALNALRKKYANVNADQSSSKLLSELEALHNDLLKAHEIGRGNS